MGTAEALAFELIFPALFIKKWIGKAYYPVNRKIKSLVSSSSPTMDYPAAIQSRF
jgi:hypothetical protein